MPSAAQAIRIRGVLDAANQRLKLAELGAAESRSDNPMRRLAGVGNVANYGGGTTNALQGLKHLEPRFESWWAAKSAELSADSLSRRFFELRKTMFHEHEEVSEPSPPSSSGVLYIKKMRTPGDLSKFGPPPPGAVSLFMGDSQGRSGWITKLPDGTTDVYYVEIPPEIGWTIPRPRGGSGVPDSNECDVYVSKVKRIVREAEALFLG